MKSKMVVSAEGFKLIGDFESLRNALLQEKYADRRDKPLAFWTLPSDRRLPLAFLGKTLDELVSTPFEELMATPGVGQKKVSSLITLLTRATQDTPPGFPGEHFHDGNGQDAARPKSHLEPGGTTFNPLAVSEVLWAQWRETVTRHDLGGEKLGRLAPTLQALPTVIWHTLLEEYVDLTLADIRQLKTHGEKRVHAVLEVFYVVHAALAESEVQEHLDIRLSPKFIPPLEKWIAERLADSKLPTNSQLRASVARPLIEQIEIDTGSTVAQLAAERLGMNGESRSVRDQARQSGVTRARVYQLLEECGKVMMVRWPEGKWQLALLGETLQSSQLHSARLPSARAKDELIDIYRVIVELFYPKSSQTTPNLLHFRSFAIPSSVPH